MPMNGSFDANQFTPKQIGSSHPVGKFDFTVTNTSIEPTKDGTGGMFVVEFTTPAGVAVNRYNIWNSSAKATEIAHGQLSALCHATGVFKLDWQNDGAALRGARGKFEIGYQKGEEPTADKPAGGYTEIKKVYDINGNEPGRVPAAAAQPQHQPTQQPAQSGQWGGVQQAAPNAQPMQPASGGQAAGWQPGPTNQQPNQQGAPAWNQGAPSSNPPWGGRQ